MVGEKTYKDLIFITLFTFIATFLIWLPHLLALNNFWGLNFQAGFDTIYRNFDGLEYIVIAKTFYQPQLISQIPQPLEAKYYASHFPGFPILITLFAPVLGYLKSMLFISMIFTVASAFAFYFLVKNYEITSNPLLLTLIFLILPARWVIVRSVGSAEPMFIFFIILSLYFLLKLTTNNQIPSAIWLSAIFASIAQLTRPPGILLGLAILFYAIYQAFLIYKQSFSSNESLRTSSSNKHSRANKTINYFLPFYPFLLVPLTLFGIFWWFGLTYNDFFAYFHSGDNIHLTLPPFQIFNLNQFWVGTIWLEDVIYVFILGFLAAFLLLKQKLYPLAFFVLTYLVASIFVAHRDISRYTLPVAPFVIIAFEKILVSKEFKIVLAILALAIYLYSQNFILNNVTPAPNLFYYN